MSLILQNIVGKPHDIIKRKVQRQLDHHSLAYLKQSTIAFLGFRCSGMSEILILDGELGFIKAIDKVTLCIPQHEELSRIDQQVFDKPLPASLYCWLPGIEETLRINGMASWLNDDRSNSDDMELRIHIEGVFIHCAKSIKRSELWTEKKQPDSKIDVKNNASELIDKSHRMFIESSPFLSLYTQDNVNQTELSPRGDPAGFVHVIDDKHLLIPDRPGNKRVDSMRNLLNDPRLALLFLIPGNDLVLKINGRAMIVNDPELLQPLAIKNKAPKLGILVTITRCQFHRSSSLKWQKIWADALAVDKTQFPTLGQILAEQTTKSQSFTTKIKGKIVDSFIKRDYQKNLY